MFNENLATLKSPDRQAKCMRIQFEIKEKLPDIISEILHSDKWLTLVRDENHGLRRVTIKDPYFDSEACVDIWEHEIHVTTAWSNYTYRIYQKGNSVWCEYIGAYRGIAGAKPFAYNDSERKHSGFGGIEQLFVW